MPTYSKTVSATKPRVSDQAGRVAVLNQVVTLATGDLVQDATFDIGWLPRGARVLDGMIAGTDMDSAASPSMVIAIGDTSDADKFISGSTVGQTAAVSRFGWNATAAKTMAEHTAYSAATKLIGTIITAPGTAVAGTLRCEVIYEVEDGY